MLRLTACFLLLTPLAIAAQTPARDVVAGDSALAARHAHQAVKDYQAAIRADSTDAVALAKASNAEVEIALFDPDTAEIGTLLQSAEAYGRAAVAHAPKSAGAHFALAQALGRIALRTPVLGRLPVATEVHKEALACLAINPKDARCLHVLGLWDAEYQRMGTYTREMANMMSGNLFATATWAEAEHNLQAAIAAEPNRMIHHFDLAYIYKDEGKADSAKAELQKVLSLPVREYDDPQFQTRAKTSLDSIGTVGQTK
ncbi:MAG: hypothetical protein ACYCVE_08420 [Gemmatimonadaceae bacterium]